MIARVFTRKEREVWQACNALLDSGIEWEKITINLIGQQLLMLGFKRGSDSAIHQHRLSWRAEMSHKLVQATCSTVSVGSDHNTEDSISDRITRAAGIFKDEIYTQVQDEVEQFKQDTQTQIHTLENTCAEQKQALEALHTKYDVLHTERDQLLDINTDLTLKLTDSENTVLKLTQKLEDLTQFSEQSLQSLRAEMTQNLQKLTDFSKQALQHSQVSVEKQLAYADQQHAKHQSELQAQMELARQAWLVDQDHARVQVQKITQAYQKTYQTWEQQQAIQLEQLNTQLKQFFELFQHTQDQTLSDTATRYDQTIDLKLTQVIRDLQHTFRNQFHELSMELKQWLEQKFHA
jgi:hypothetical protein